MIRNPEKLRRVLEDLWAIAYGPRTVVTVQRWQALGPYFERAVRAARDGKWRFVV